MPGPGLGVPHRQGDSLLPLQGWRWGALALGRVSVLEGFTARPGSFEKFIFGSVLLISVWHLHRVQGKPLTARAGQLPVPGVCTSQSFSAHGDTGTPEVTAVFPWPHTMWCCQVVGAGGPGSAAEGQAPK